MAEERGQAHAGSSDRLGGEPMMGGLFPSSLDQLGSLPSGSVERGEAAGSAALGCEAIRD